MKRPIHQHGELESYSVCDVEPVELDGLVMKDHPVVARDDRTVCDRVTCPCH